MHFVAVCTMRLDDDGDDAAVVNGESDGDALANILI